jgi:hypothetical protein
MRVTGKDGGDGMLNSYPLVSKLLSGEVTNLRRFVYEDDKAWSCFNPSIGYSPKLGYAIAFRSSNYVIMPDSGELYVETGGPIRNKVWFSEINDKFELLDLREISFEKSGHKIGRGVEDVKLFWRDGKWNFTGVFLERHVPVARMCTGVIDPVKNLALDVKLHGSTNPKKPEKNWAVAAEPNKYFDFIHGPTSIIKDDKIIFSMSENQKIAPLRGNTNLLTLDDGTYLALNHILYTRKTSTYDARTFGMRDGLYKNYTHMFVRYDERGQLIEMGDEFQFISDGIEFAGGLVERGDELIVSFGKSDVSSHIAVIPKLRALRNLKSV